MFIRLKGAGWACPGLGTEAGRRACRGLLGRSYISRRAKSHHETSTVPSLLHGQMLARPGRHNTERFGRTAGVLWHLASGVRRSWVHPVLGPDLQLSSRICADPVPPPLLLPQAQHLLPEFSRIRPQSGRASHFVHFLARDARAHTVVLLQSADKAQALQTSFSCSLLAGSPARESGFFVLSQSTVNGHKSCPWSNTLTPLRRWMENSAFKPH